MDRLLTRAEKAEADNKKLRAALELIETGGEMSPISIAREALAEIEKEAGR